MNLPATSTTRGRLEATCFSENISEQSFCSQLALQLGGVKHIPRKSRSTFAHCALGTKVANASIVIDYGLVMELLNFIDGEFVACGDYLDSYNPATGEVHLQVPDSGKEEVEKAAQAALRAFKT